MARTQHPFELYGMDTVLKEGLDVHDFEVKELLAMILIELRVANNHLYSMTDEEVERC